MMPQVAWMLQASWRRIGKQERVTTLALYVLSYDVDCHCTTGQAINFGVVLVSSCIRFRILPLASHAGLHAWLSPSVSFSRAFVIKRDRLLRIKPACSHIIRISWHLKTENSKKVKKLHKWYLFDYHLLSINFWMWFKLSSDLDPVPVVQTDS